MSLITDILNRASSLILDLDPDGKSRFKSLQDKVICLELTNPEITLYLAPDGDELRITQAILQANTTSDLSETADSEADVVFSGSLASFIRLAREGAHSGVFSSGQITIRGDVETGQAFQKAVMGFDLDWEELVSRFIGDTPARKAGVLVRDFKLWAEESAEYSRENIADYLKEEKRWLPSSVAVEQFRQRVTELRADVDRFEKRISQLRKRMDSRGDREP